MGLDLITSKPSILGRITYSPAYTLVPTYECFNRCEYCNFRVDPGQDSWLSLENADQKLRSLQNRGITEILILSGEVHPRSPRREEWFQHIYHLCELALSLGFFPHTNVGPLSYQEMERLKQVNVSMGLMIEQVTPRLLETVHRQAPSKLPELRLQQLRWAGELKIPFTTGILLGIGEREEDWWESLTAIAAVQEQYGHIQEVIIQPYCLGQKQGLPITSFSLAKLPQIITQAKAILPQSITLQIPPNLIVDQQILLACLEAGARDLGGISPIDEVNPSYPHQDHQELSKILQRSGWDLVSRLPVYPAYYSWLDPILQEKINKMITKNQENYP
jgi:FO synthase subunit 1